MSETSRVKKVEGNNIYECETMDRFYVKEKRSEVASGKVKTVNCTDVRTEGFGSSEDYINNLVNRFGYERIEENIQEV